MKVSLNAGIVRGSHDHRYLPSKQPIKHVLHNLHFHTYCNMPRYIRVFWVSCAQCVWFNRPEEQKQNFCTFGLTLTLTLNLTAVNGTRLKTQLQALSTGHTVTDHLVAASSRLILWCSTMGGPNGKCYQTHLIYASMSDFSHFS